MSRVEDILQRCLRQLQQGGDPRTPLRDLMSIAGHAERFPLINLAIGTAYLDLHMHNEAIAYLRVAKAHLPRRFDLTYSLSRALRHTGQMNEALLELKECMDYCPAEHRTVVLDNITAVLVELGKPDEAMRFGAQMVVNRPTVITLMRFFEHAKRASSDTLIQACMRPLAAVLERCATRESIEKNLADVLPGHQLHALLGRIHSELGDFKAALAEYRISYNERPNDEVLGEIAYQLGAMSHYEEAIEAYRTLASKHPENEAIWYSLGNMLFSADRYEEAAEALRRAPGAVAQKPNGHYMLGFISLLRRDVPAARKEMRAALELNPGYDRAWRFLFGLAITEAKLDDVRRCLGELSSLGKLQLRDYEVAVRFFATHSANKDLADLILTHGSVRGDDKVGLSADQHMLGVAYMGMKQWQKARATLEKALDSDVGCPGQFWLPYNLAAVYQKLGVTSRCDIHPKALGLQVDWDGEILDELKVVPVYVSRRAPHAISASRAAQLASVLLSGGTAEQLPGPDELNRMALGLANTAPWTAVDLLYSTKERYPDFLDTYNNLGYLIPRVTGEDVMLRAGRGKVTYRSPLLLLKFLGPSLDFGQCRIQEAIAHLEHVLERAPGHLQARINYVSIALYLSWQLEPFRNRGIEMVDELQRAIRTPEQLWTEIIDLAEKGELLHRFTESRNVASYADDGETNLAARVVFKKGDRATIERERAFVEQLAAEKIKTPKVLGYRSCPDGNAYLVLLNEGESLVDAINDIRAHGIDSLWRDPQRSPGESERQLVLQSLEELGEIAAAGARLQSPLMQLYDIRGRLEGRFMKPCGTLAAASMGGEWGRRFIAGCEQVIGILQARRALYYKDASLPNWVVTRGPKGVVVRAIDFETALLGPSQLDLVNLLENSSIHFPPEAVQEYVQKYWEVLRDAISLRESRTEYVTGYHCAGVIRHCELAGSCISMGDREGKADELKRAALRHLVTAQAHCETLAGDLPKMRSLLNGLHHEVGSIAAWLGQ